MIEYKLIDKDDSMGFVSSAIEARDNAEWNLLETRGPERFVRMDEVYNYLELLADAAIKISFQHISGHGGTMEVKMNSFAAKIVSEYKDFANRGKGFLNESELEIVLTEFPWVIKAILDSTEEDPFDISDSLALANQLVERFESHFKMHQNQRKVTDREIELIELKKPWKEKRELLNKLLRVTYPDGENRAANIDEFGEALAYDQIYEIQRQNEVYNSDDDESIEGMFGHLVNSILTLRALSKTKRAYTSPAEAERINIIVRGVVYEFFKGNTRYLEIFEKVFRDMSEPLD